MARGVGEPGRPPSLGRRWLERILGPTLEYWAATREEKGVQDDAGSLPYRLTGTAPGRPVLAVDGALGAEGLELSHWPGNRTPKALRRPLSTGSALAFARLPERERQRLLRGVSAIVNNHYDTDGLCAVWALLNPRLALALEGPLLATAAAGDFFQVPDEASFVRDLLIQAAADPERSPIAAELDGLEDLDRLRRASEYVLGELGQWLAADLGDPELQVHRHLWQIELERLRLDRGRLAQAKRTDHPDLDLTVFEIDEPLDSAELPGRHGLFAQTDRDRVLVSTRREDGNLHRLIVGTRSWFDLDPPHAAPPRFDLEQALARLRAEEPTSEAGGWYGDTGSHPSPEVWFGQPDQKAFLEHHAGLLPSALTAGQVVDVVRG